MNTISLVSLLLIISGAIIMALNVLKFRRVFDLVKQFSLKESENNKSFFNIHQALMLFFLLGYGIVAVAIIKEFKLVGDLLIGPIFFFGAIFVLLGILLQLRMLASIRKSYLKNKEINTVLSREQAKLIKSNEKLNQEIEERQLAEQLLKKSETHLKTIFRSVQAGIIMIDAETHKILNINDAALEMIKTSREKVLGSVCHKFICPAELGNCPVTDLGNFKDNSERTLIDEAGNSRPILKTVATVEENGREILVESFVDISQQKEVEEALEKSKTIAETASRTKSEFLANMSHEFRTPLNHIIGFTELVVDQNFGELNEVQTEYLTDVLQSSRHLLSLITDILDLSKVESGKFELQLSCVDLRGLLENSLTMVKEKAMKHGIKLSINMNGIPDTITADKRKIKQIMYNLLSNAVKFTPNGGKVSVTAQACGLEDVQLSTVDSDQNYGIKINASDTGIGLNPEDSDRIFSPFEQVECLKNRKFQGTGLGLSLTKRLVELHGGRIWADSEGEGKGSTFSFIIPATLTDISFNSETDNQGGK